MDLQDPITVYTLHDSVKAELIKNQLQAEGIRCLLEGANQGHILGLHFSEIGIIVQAIDADRARKIIDLHESGKSRPHGWTENAAGE